VTQLLLEGILVGRWLDRALMIRMRIGLVFAAGDPQALSRPQELTLPVAYCVHRATQPSPGTRYHLRPHAPRLCLTAASDVGGCRLLAHKAATTLEACHAREVIEQAFARFGLPARQYRSRHPIYRHRAQYERVYFKAYDNVSAARADNAEYFRWHNTKKPRSSLEDKAPEETCLNVLSKLSEAA
jgi:putative transposase